MIGEQQAPYLIFALGAIVLVASALVARRPSFGQLLRITLGWIAIFALALVIFSFQPELKMVWNRVKAELTGAADQRIVGDTLRIRQSADGHFWVNASVNGTPVRFLIDSGATFTAINGDTATRAGLDISNGAFPVILETANGRISARRGRVNTLAIGPMRVEDLPVVVSDSFGRTNVLGMNFLSDLKNWRVEAGEMILTPHSSADLT